MYYGHCKTLHSAKDTKNTKKSENKLRGSTSCAAGLCRAAHRMTGLGQSLRDPHSLMTEGKPWGNLPGSDCGSVCHGGAEVWSTRRQSPWVNLRRSLQLGAWIVLSLREDEHLFLLSCELKHLHIGIAALSEVRKPDCGEIMVGGYTYYWSGHSDGYHSQGVAVVVSNKLTPMIIEATSVKERIMRLRIRHSLGVISLVSVFAPTEVSDLTVKDAFSTTLESVVDQCPGRDTLLFLGSKASYSGSQFQTYGDQHMSHNHPYQFQSMH